MKEDVYVKILDGSYSGFIQIWIQLKTLVRGTREQNSAFYPPQLEGFFLNLASVDSYFAWGRATNSPRPHATSSSSRKIKARVM